MAIKGREVNNVFYDTLDSLWDGAADHPIALLRAENAVRTPWVQSMIKRTFTNSCSVLDIGCGGGLLTNPLALDGHHVVGIDLSEPSLEWAKKSDTTKSAIYLKADAKCIPLPDESFDVICAMDLLEHVTDPELVIKEASRLLKPDGHFYFHTFNRSLLSYLLVIKGVEWFVKNTPKDMHIYSHFITPKELKNWCNTHQLTVNEVNGFVPDMKKAAFWKTAITRKIDKNFSFKFSKSIATGYVGYATKRTT